MKDFERIFLEHYAELCKFAEGYVRSKSAAEDVVSDVFAWVWTNYSTWKPEVSVKSFLYGAVRNRCINALRDDATSNRITASPTIIEFASPSSPIKPDDALAQKNIEDTLRSALTDFPERQRAIVVMRHGGGMSWKEISAALGISPNAAEIEHRRVLQKLREKLSREMF